INTALIDVRLRKGTRTADAIERLRRRLNDLPSGTVSLETGQATAVNKLLGAGESDLAVRVQGENMDTLFAHARSVERLLAGVTSLSNVRLGSGEGQPEILVEINRERAAAYGIEPSEITKVVDASMRGVSATDYIDFDRKVAVIVRLPESARQSLETLRELRVRDVPLRELITTREGIGPAEIRRVDQRRVVAVQADVARGGVDDAISDARGAMRGLTTPAGVQVEIGGENEELRLAFRALALAFALAVLLVYMILAAEFESLVLPFVVLLSVPLGTIGAIVALWISGAGLNAVSLIGIVVLAGIVDNDAVVKVDFINQMRRKGRSVREAIVEAGHARFRPIVINSITAMLGLLPMALALGPGAELQAPLAIAVFGGLFTATALTLVVVPVAYDLMEEMRERAAGNFVGQRRGAGVVTAEPVPGD
ncbi:MAG: efflux RND transporter permease subunit, partial [Gemmatimonadota bacterium]|nr:efflux RND transporter permease subunit [Gemmatimonadota bacterium]